MKEGDRPTPFSILTDLAAEWRADAERLRSYGADPQALTCERHADDLEARLTRWQNEELSLEEAAEEAGLAYDTVQKKVASGELPNRGEKYRPKVRRADLYPALQNREQPDVVMELLAPYEDSLECTYEPEGGPEPRRDRCLRSGATR